MPKVGIVMGSDSDMKVMGKLTDMLEKFGIDYEMTIISHTVSLMYSMNMRSLQKQKTSK